MERILSRDSNIRNKSTVWTTWHQELAPLVNNFSTILTLADKAAKENGEYFGKIKFVLRV